MGSTVFLIPVFGIVGSGEAFAVTRQAEATVVISVQCNVQVFGFQRSLSQWEPFLARARALDPF